MAQRGLLLVLVLTLFTLPVFAADPPPMMIPAGPLPVQIIGAKKVFIANLAGDNVSANQKAGTADESYNRFYDAMQTWGNYQLVSSPAAADLIFELQLSSSVIGNGRDVSSYATLGVVIVDPGSQLPLWTLHEYYTPDNNAYLKAMDALVADVKALAVRASQETMTDARIATAVTTMTQIDVDFAKAVLDKSNNKDLCAFAQQMVDDNTAVQKSIQAVAQQLGLKQEESFTGNWLRTQSNKVQNRFNATYGKSFDKYYAADEAIYQQIMVNEIADSLLPSVQSPQLKEALQNAQATLLKHLASVQKLSAHADQPSKPDNSTQTETNPAA